MRGGFGSGVRRRRGGMFLDLRCEIIARLFGVLSIRGYNTPCCVGSSLLLPTLIKNRAEFQQCVKESSPADASPSCSKRRSPQHQVVQEI